MDSTRTEVRFQRWDSDGSAQELARWADVCIVCVGNHPNTSPDWDGQTVYVRCAEVPAPVAVRYSYRNWMGANLQTSYGIPVPPFRSDDWPL